MSYHDKSSIFDVATALPRLDPMLLPPGDVVDPQTAPQRFAEFNGAIVHAMPTGAPNSFAMIGFTYEPAFSVVPLELVAPNKREPLQSKRGLRPSAICPGFAEIVAPKPLRNIREALELGRAWVDVAVLGKSGFLG